MPKKIHKMFSQREFAPILYDSLFGLVLFFSLESFLEITDPAHFSFYLFTTVIVIHWWLMFKAADDQFVKGVRDTAVHIFINVVYILLLEFMILYSEVFDYVRASAFLLAVLILDSLWAVMVLKVNHWGSATKNRISDMKEELRNILISDAILISGLIVIMILSFMVTPTMFVSIFILLYALFIYLSFRFKIIDIKIF